MTPSQTIDKRANFTRDEIAAACRAFASSVGPLPAGVNATQLLWALAGNESSFGKDCQPRHEPAYDVGGRYATHAPMPGLLALYGPSAACSYGPWQLMLCEAAGMSPSSFDYLQRTAQATVVALNGFLRRWQPSDLADIGECWNAGHITPDPVYTTRLAVNYAVVMPPVPVAPEAAEPAVAPAVNA